MRLREVRGQLERMLRVAPGVWKNSDGLFVAAGVEAHRLRKAGPGRCVAWVQFHRLTKQLQRRSRNLRMSRFNEAPGGQIMVVGLAIPDTCPGKGPRPDETAPYCAGDCLAHASLDLENVVELSVVAAGPELDSVAHPDQRRADAYKVAL